MSLDTVVRGDPDDCRRAARRLERLAAELDAAAATLARHSHLPADAFGGLSGDAFRGRAAGLARVGEAEGRRCERLGRALEELALDLEDAGRVMTMARVEARELLAVDAVFIHPPEGDQARSPLAQRAWRAVAALVARARAVEARAQADWTATLRELADLPGPLPDRSAGPDDPGRLTSPHLPAVGPHLAPPVREHWVPPAVGGGSGAEAPPPTCPATPATGPAAAPPASPAPTNGATTPDGGGPEPTAGVGAAPVGPGPAPGTLVAEPVGQPCAEPWPPPEEDQPPPAPTEPPVCGTPWSSSISMTSGAAGR